MTNDVGHGIPCLVDLYLIASNGCRLPIFPEAESANPTVGEAESFSSKIGDSKCSPFFCKTGGDLFSRFLFK